MSKNIKGGSKDGGTPKIGYDICPNEPSCYEPKCMLGEYHRRDGFPKCRETPMTEEEERILRTSFNGTTSSKWSSSSYKTTVFKDKCRHAPTPAFRLAGTKITYMGGSESKVNPRKFDGLVVCLLGDKSYITPPQDVVGNDGWADSLQDFTNTYQPVKDYITIDWSDGGAPPVDVGFWTALHNEVQKRGLQKVLFYCMGGHGRTGTALASILIEVAGFDPDSAVKWIHKNYCKEAIETNSQINYLNDLWDKVTKAKSAKSKGKSESSSGSSE